MTQYKYAEAINSVKTNTVVLHFTKELNNFLSLLTIKNVLCVKVVTNTVNRLLEEVHSSCARLASQLV